MSGFLTDKKENKIFLIYKETQNGAVAKSYMTKASSSLVKYLRISSYIMGSPSSYKTSQLLHFLFTYIWGKFSNFISSVTP